MAALSRLPNLLRWAFLALGLLTVLGLGMAALIWHKGNDWKTLAISTVNDHIQGDLEVVYVELSWWNGFPDISVDLKQVALTSASGDTLLEAKRVGVELSFWSLWGDHPRVHAVRLEDGQMTVLQDPSGQWNLMDVLSPSSRTSEHDGDGSGFTLDEVQFHNIQTSGVLSDGTDFRLLLDDASVDIHADTPDIHWALDARNVQLASPQLPSLKPFDAECSGTMLKNQDATWAVASEVVVEGISAALSASVDAEKRWTGKIRVPSVSMRQLERVVHDAPWKGLASLDHRIELDANASKDAIEMVWSAPEDAFQLSPSLTGLTMNLQGLASGHGTATFDKRGWTWAVEQAQIAGTGWRLEGAARPLPTSGIELDGSLHLDASTPLEAWIPNVPPSVESILPVSGQLTAEGTIAFDGQQRLKSVQGQLRLSELAGKLNGQPYQVDAPAVHFGSETFSADSISCQWAGNAADLDVSNLSWSSWMKGGAVNGAVTVRATSLWVDPLLTCWDHFSQGPVEDASLLPPGSMVKVKVGSQDLEWGVFRATNLSSTLKLEHSRCLIQSATWSALEGNAHVEGSLAPGRAGWLLSLRGAAEDVSLPKLFSTFNNFDQTLVRHDHLSGACTAAGSMGMSWGLDGTWHPEDFTANLKMSILHGRLRGLEVFDDVADHLEGHRLIAPLVDPDDLRQRLRDVEFNPVSQFIDVRGESVWLPSTLIESSAMNVSVEGSFGFDATIDYTLGFALRDLRGGAHDAIGQMEDDGLGNQFFLRMFGPVDAPEYAYDRDAAKQHRRDALAAEKKRLRDAMRDRRDDPTEVGDSPVAPQGPDSLATQGSPTPEPTDKASETKKPNEGNSPTLLNRIRRPKDKGKSNLFNPDDEDYL